MNTFDVYTRVYFMPNVPVFGGKGHFSVIKGIIVKVLGSVKAEIIKKFVISPAVGEIIELYLCCVLSEYLNIYIIYQSTA